MPSAVAVEDNGIKPAGTLLLTCNPFVFAGNLQASTTICDTCLKPGDREEGELSRCSTCKMVLYCNKSCQKKGWTDGHKYECKGMKFHGITPGHLPRLLLRAIVKLQDGVDHYEEIWIGESTVQRRFKDLISHCEEIREDKASLLAVERTITSAKLLLFPMKKKIRIPDDDELLEMCGRIFNNAFMIGEGTLGFGVNLAASIFNHSCEEMAIRTFEGTTMFVRNIKPISGSLPLNEVSLNYIDILKPTEERRKDLKENYYFDCACERCSQKLFDREMRSIVCPNSSCKKEIFIDDLSNPCGGCGDVVDAKLAAEIRDTEKYILEKKNAERFFMLWDSETNDAYIDRMTKAHFSETNWLMITMLTKGFENAYGTQDWKKAYEYGSKYIAGLRRYLHPCSGELTQALIRMAWVTLFLKKLEEAEILTTEAASLIEISHGKDSLHFKETVGELRRSIEFTKMHRDMEVLGLERDEAAQESARGS